MPSGRAMLVLSVGRPIFKCEKTPYYPAMDHNTGAEQSRGIARSSSAILDRVMVEIPRIPRVPVATMCKDMKFALLFSNHNGRLTKNGAHAGKLFAFPRAAPLLA
eukprot:1542956-Rhodomonas_salina.1